MEPKLDYDPDTRKAVISFPNGHKLTVSNVDEAKANDFFRKHAAEFARRDCVLHTVGSFERRSESNGE
jgi:hypothetical protein